MHKVGTLAGFLTAFLVYAIGVLRGNSMLSLLARSGIAFAAAYLMILVFGFLVVISSGRPNRAEPQQTPPSGKKPDAAKDEGQQPFAIPEQK